MKMIRLPLLILCMGALLLPTLAAQNTPAPTPTVADALSGGAQSNNWVDSATGHRVFQVTPEKESEGLYFTQNDFTPDGKEMVYSVLESVHTGRYSMNVVNLTTLQSRQLVAPPVDVFVVSRKSPNVYFTRPKETGLYVVGVDTGEVQKIGDLPERSVITTLNADETLLAGTSTDVVPPLHPYDKTLDPSKNRATLIDERLADQVPMTLFTVNVQTGKVNPILHSTDWLNHPQFSPTDPTLLMYCHEGPWHKVDRIWTIRADGSGNKLIHQRTVNGEIAGHEFWDADGITIWYDLQIPRGQNFYLASYNTTNGARRWYSLDRDMYSLHYAVTPSHLFMAGDGAGENSIARSKNARWIELFVPVLSVVPTEIDQTKLVQSGVLTATHLVSLSMQDYKLLEPNVRFSPDHKLVLFNGDMFGPSHVYAVEVAKATDVAPSTTTPAPAAGQ
ncbi:MAG: oligogalacturonate lyase family protein [Terracidiphilus sp.]|jgi:oligogalacturonide lyase